MNVTKIAEKITENFCPLVNALVKYQTCKKCCFKGEQLYFKLLHEQISCREGCCKREVYENSQVVCNFLFSDKDQ
jgi:hypothetical protein